MDEKNSNGSFTDVEVSTSREPFTEQEMILDKSCVRTMDYTGKLDSDDLTRVIVNYYLLIPPSSRFSLWAYLFFIFTNVVVLAFYFFFKNN